LFPIFEASMPSMIRMSVFMLMAALWFGAATGWSRDQPDWSDETGILKSELEARHPDLYFRGDSTPFTEALARVSSSASAKPLFSVAVELQQAVAMLGDPQTRVNYHYLVDPARILPLRLYWFEDGLRVIRADRKYASLLGKEVLMIGSVPLQVVVDSLSSLLPAATPSRIRDQIPRMLTWSQLLEHFGFADSAGVVLTVKGTEDRTLTTTISVPATRGETVTVEADSLPLGFRDNRVFFREQYFPATKSFYIQYNKCWSREAEKKYGSGVSALFMPSFADFSVSVLHTLRTQEVETLVLDLRFNDGGAVRQGQSLIRKMKRTRAARHARVCLLVGRKTEAEALSNALFFIRAFNPVVIGEPSGGTPNYFGEVQRFVLEESGLVVNCPTKTINPMENDGKAPLVPQVREGIAFDDYLKGVDPAFETATRSPIIPE